MSFLESASESALGVGCGLLGVLLVWKSKCLFVKMSASVKESSFSVISNVINMSATNFSELVAFRLRDLEYKDAVDNHLPGTWARVLTNEIIRSAFENEKLYLIQQAYKAHVWSWESREIEEVNKKGLTVRKMKANVELFVKPPDVYFFPFVDYFCFNRFPSVDQLCETLGVDLVSSEGLKSLERLDSAGRDVLWHAIRQTDTKRVKFYLDRGIDIRKQRGADYLYQAVEIGYLPVIKLLVDKGCIPSTSRSPIFVASYEVLDYLLNSSGLNFDINRLTKDDETILTKNALRHYNIYRGYQLFIEKGIDLNRTNKLGQTACHLFGPKQIAFLVSKGAKLDIVDKYGCTPLMTFCECYAQDGDSGSNLQIFFDYKVDPRHITTQGQTIFHLAHESLSYMKALIKYFKADFPNDLVNVLNVRDRYGKTVLHYLTDFTHSNEARIELLIENGANPLLPNNRHRKAIDDMKEGLYERILNNIEKRKKDNQTFDPPSDADD